MYHPLVEEVFYQDPLIIFSKIADKKGAVLLDSAEQRAWSGRYSFIGYDPFQIFQSKNDEIDPLVALKQKIAEYSLNLHPELPPFQGGVIGYFGYELSHHLEILPRVEDVYEFPDLILGFYDLVMAFDHQQKKSWIFSSGYPEKHSLQRERRAVQRLEFFKKTILSMGEIPSLSTKIISNPTWQSNFTQSKYEEAVLKVMNYIRAGDIFEANISQCFNHELTNLTGFELYCKLRAINPAPFAAFLNFDAIQIASASPERFLRLQSGKIETRPIKGTIKRSVNAAEDSILAKKLLASAKDRAENIMIVDLMRNDLSRVCENFSVQVTKLCDLESYATVHHLVSVIEGKLKNAYDAIDLLRVTFPGGSITGAPKIRAMEIIAEIEKITRGPYCGAIGYIGFNGDMDLSITIRTYAIKNNCVTFHVGGAITLDSNPADEYHETLIKAKALHQAIL